MPVTADDAKKIGDSIMEIFPRILGEYDFGKYPADEYAGFKKSFADLNPSNEQIQDAMIWKWGHSGKENFPGHHKDLIKEIQGSWGQFTQSGCSRDSELTFNWWRLRLEKPTRYITVAYITHLVHHKEPPPIIDQHNFRAMNALIAPLYPCRKFRKKPSTWADIVSLRSFMKHLQCAMGDCDFQELDRFLMMYGRNHARR